MAPYPTEFNQVTERRMAFDTLQVKVMLAWVRGIKFRKEPSLIPIF